MHLETVACWQKDRLKYGMSAADHLTAASGEQLENATLNFLEIGHQSGPQRQLQSSWSLQLHAIVTTVASGADCICTKMSASIHFCADGVTDT